MSPPEGSHPPLPSSAARALVCTVLSLSFAVGVPGNAFVIWTICGRMQQRPLSVMLILHLAIADLLVLMTLPIWIYSFADTWLFGPVTCKALAFVIYFSMYASIFLITALSVERYMAVFYPFVVQRWKNKMVTHLVVPIIWFLSLAFGMTILPFQDTDDTEMGLQCAVRSYETTSQEVTCLLVESAVGFFIPFAIISVCYVHVSRRIGAMTCPSKRRSVRLIASVVIAFCLCWLPHHVFNLISVVSLLMKDLQSEALEAISAVGVCIAGSLAFISSCVNPLLYAFAARNFRSTVRFTRLSRLFEQMSPLTRQEATKVPIYRKGKEDASTSVEMI